ncbi:alpha-L-arabinofuranosidase C-terminal domain-containing protein [Novosphingobium sp. G106]|uniref:alpha-L-arabinofuranosidase C-terminal domain-containing protein n=1 Tax=Novosphingobium sp. G106 TaxID=2849500 RepID=UPI0020C2C8B6|nr:alpha-L-arabinofuranosidase C-terminal domain-containing protein [Novosphingobium sp. G106]
MHHYTWGEAMLRALPYGFGEKEYAGLLKETYEMEKLISERSAIMDKYDPKKQVALVVDEWGVWLKPEPGLHPMFLKQQTSLRDAIAASININIFARHADRVRMTNIAQMVNVLQGMILTENEKMVLTPTYHVFKMYVPFQDSTFIPVSYAGGEYKFDKFAMPKVDAIAARGKDGKVWVALTNLDPNNPADYTVNVQGVSASSAIGEVLTAPKMDSINTYQVPATVAPRPFSAQAAGGKLTLTLPPKSVTVVRLEP